MKVRRPKESLRRSRRSSGESEGSFSAARFLLIGIFPQQNLRAVLHDSERSPLTSMFKHMADSRMTRYSDIVIRSSPRRQHSKEIVSDFRPLSPREYALRAEAIEPTGGCDGGEVIPEQEIQGLSRKKCAENRSVVVVLI